MTSKNSSSKQQKKSDKSRASESSSSSSQNANSAQKPPVIEVKAKDMSADSKTETTEKKAQEEVKTTKPTGNTDNKTAKAKPTQTNKNHASSSSSFKRMVMMFFIGLPLGVGAGYIATSALLGEEKIDINTLQDDFAVQTNILARDINALKEQVKYVESQMVIALSNDISDDIETLQKGLNALHQQQRMIEKEWSGFAEQQQNLTQQWQEDTALLKQQNTTAEQAVNQAPNEALLNQIEALQQQQIQLENEIAKQSITQNDIADITQRLLSLQSELESTKIENERLALKVDASGSASMVAKTLALQQFEENLTANDGRDVHVENINLLKVVGLPKADVDELLQLHEQGIQFLGLAGEK